MATINLGNIKFNWQGAYNGATAYAVDDVVEYNGSSYICTLASTGNLPTNTTYFDVMSQAGTNGTDVGTVITTQGDILYRDGSGLQRLGAGTAGDALITGGAGANPYWGTVSAGKVLQVVSTNFTSEVTSSSSTFVDVSGFTASITPSSASNKILITVDITFGGTSDAYPAAKLFRNTTEIFSGTNATGSMTACFLGGSGLTSSDKLLSSSRTVLDSPSTTSATTYKIQFANPYNSPTYNGYINRSHNKANAPYTQSNTSGITLMEIGG